MYEIELNNIIYIEKNRLSKLIEELCNIKEINKFKLNDKFIEIKNKIFEELKIIKYKIENIKYNTLKFKLFSHNYYINIRDNTLYFINNIIII
jgi:hypothetical protein